jgi:aerobic-type carbon monoxide dehydrogenase small subunit (CoxS/CutS family)
MMRLSLILLLACSSANAFLGTAPQQRTAVSQLNVIVAEGTSGYEPQWKKKETIGGGDLAEKDKGLQGNIPVIFKQGNVTKTTMAIVGQPLSDVATQANQFIKYGCKKGECGTCECMSDGKWIRPCVEGVPALAAGEELVIILKEMKSKTTSSGKFYSVRSFFMGFYNNAIGMIGFVKTRREAKKNWNDRLDYEELIRIKTMEKKAARAETKVKSGKS